MCDVSLNIPISTSQEAVVVLKHIRSILFSQENRQVQTVVQSHPEIGSVLSELCSNPKLLLDEHISSLVLECILWFYRSQPEGPLEVRVNTWVSHQLGKCMRLPQPQESVIGACQWQWNEAFLKLKLLVSEALNRGNSLDVSATQWLAKFGIVLIHQADKDESLIKKLLQVLSQSCESVLSFPYVETFLDTVSAQWKKGQLALPLESTLHLWICHQPSLEWTILDLVDKLADSETVKHTLEESGLKNACHLSSQILGRVLRMVCCLTVKSSFNPVLLSLLHDVQEIVQKCPRQLVLEAFPSRLHQSVVLLQVHIDEVPTEEIHWHLTCIFNSLRKPRGDSSIDDNDDIVLLMMTFPSWLAALLAVITRNQEIDELSLKIQAAFPNGRRSCVRRAAALTSKQGDSNLNQAVDSVLSNVSLSCCRGISLAALFLRCSTSLPSNTTAVSSSCSALWSWCQTHRSTTL